MTSDDHVTDQPEQPKVAVGNPAFKLLGRVSLAHVKAGVLLGAAAIFFVAVIATPFGALPWWAPLVGLALLGGVVAWLRSSAVKQQSARRPAAPEAAPRRRPAASPAPAARPAPVAKPAQPTAPTERRAPVVAGRIDESAPHTEPAHHTEEQPVAQEAVYDVAAVMEADAAEHAAAHPQAEPEPGSWAPVQVPPPTYTMKARAADRSEPEPVAEQPRVSYADMPTEDLPFDGLALDEDLEELPAVHRAV